MKEIIIDTLIDTIKLIPFLLITYIIIEYIEHKMTDKSKDVIKESGKWGPLIGGIVGIIPQCGFSASATNLYVARVISLGTLFSVYLATSDEMIPIFISEAVSLNIILKVLAIKFLIAIFFGFIIDFFMKKKFFNKEENKTIENEIEELCEHDHCDCKNKGIIKSAIKHTINITIYILLITFIINVIVGLIGEENIENFVNNNTILGPIFTCLIGIIPNCAASVIITNLYIQNIINEASLIAGLLTGAGVGLIILFKMNRNIKENIKITLLLYGIGVLSGILLQLI